MRIAQAEDEEHELGFEFVRVCLALLRTVTVYPMHVCIANCARAQAEDWEHEFEFADDDQDQGADEVYDDDPGGGVHKARGNV